MSQIANCDWPDEYPELLTSLISLISSNSPESVHGAMQVFTEFIKSDLTEDQILPVLRELLPVLLTILGSTEVPLCLESVLRVNPNAYLLVSFTANSCPHHLSVPSMRHSFVYGERSASAGSN